MLFMILVHEVHMEIFMTVMIFYKLGKINSAHSLFIKVHERVFMNFDELLGKVILT